MTERAARSNHHCDATCPDHPHLHFIHFCPACRGSTGGASKSDVKQATARRNGKKGGAPRKTEPKAKP